MILTKLLLVCQSSRGIFWKSVFVIQKHIPPYRYSHCVFIFYHNVQRLSIMVLYLTGSPTLYITWTCALTNISRGLWPKRTTMKQVFCLTSHIDIYFNGLWRWGEKYNHSSKQVWNLKRIYINCIAGFLWMRMIICYSICENIFVLYKVKITQLFKDKTSCIQTLLFSASLFVFVRPKMISHT